MKDHKDKYYKLAKKTGYRSRAAYKLLEINGKFGILDRARKVIEIGSSPGGWTDVLLETEPEFLLCVDIAGKKTDDFPIFVKGDVTKENTWVDVRDKLSGLKVDLILSDAMAHTTGQHDRDHSLSIDICNSIVDQGIKVLRVGGNMLLKQFQGQYTKEFVDKYKGYFKRNYITKPSVSRSESSEIYIFFAGLIDSH